MTTRRQESDQSHVRQEERTRIARMMARIPTAELKSDLCDTLGDMSLIRFAILLGRRQDNEIARSPDLRRRLRINAKIKHRIRRELKRRAQHDGQ